ncbi:hypothetical protein [Flavobacterium sp. JP2137]|uniref:hypothetical protein n=1 Tax=Flavobacterium sp. JP2137 TaxID=3414510 RepID=UPI003D2FE68F
MIKVQDNYLPNPLFQKLQEYCYQNNFERVQAGEKEFEILKVPPEILPYLEIEGYEMNLSFIRRAHKDFDTDWRIHADNIINGKKTLLASVLYINKAEGVSENGTAMWIHEKYGTHLPDDASNEEFDRLLLEDSNDLRRWEKCDYIKSVPNRLLTYSATIFHSKYPNAIEQGERIVLVAFYC